MRRETNALLDRLGETLDIDRPLEDLPLAQRQMVALARALSHKSRLLIMDEPTASLSSRETRTLFRILRQLKNEGVGILYISHRLEEVFELATQVSVLRDGRLIETRPVQSVSRDEIVRLMVGREIATLVSSEDRSSDGPVVLDVRGLTQTGAFHNISFSVRAGEVVGLAGLVGAGRSEVAVAIFGIERANSGTVRVSNRRLRPGSVRSAINAGVALVPEDRQHQGLVLPLSVGANLLLAVLSSLSRGGFRSRRREKEAIEVQMRSLSVKAADASVPASSLSGGNQQKLVLGKWLATSPRVLLLDEPTRGVDVGAKAEVYRLVRKLAGEGMATVLISSDLPELLTLSDRILVLCEGRLTGELSRAEATEESILALALPVGSEAGVARG
jgi:ABC-type sugar transport system ATPase subunit